MYMIYILDFVFHDLGSKSGLIFFFKCVYLISQKKLSRFFFFPMKITKFWPKKNEISCGNRINVNPSRTGSVPTAILAAPLCPFWQISRYTPAPYLDKVGAGADKFKRNITFLFLFMLLYPALFTIERKSYKMVYSFIYQMLSSPIPTLIQAFIQKQPGIFFRLMTA